jgi:trans-aconitate methyltransferase
MNRKEDGAKGFSERYWLENYGDIDDMDGIYNARDHSRYLQAIFNLDQIAIASIADFGFGPGYIFAAVLDTFKPYRSLGLEPSPSAFNKAQKVLQRYQPQLLQQDIASWCLDQSQQQRFDLGICTSVLQYIDDDVIVMVIAALAQRVKYLYLTVPTAAEQQRFVDQHQFVDHYAYSRSREQYKALLSPYFTVVSSRLLESKAFYTDKNSDFTEDLFRF